MRLKKGFPRRKLMHVKFLAAGSGSHQGTLFVGWELPCEWKRGTFPAPNTGKALRESALYRR